MEFLRAVTDFDEGIGPATGLALREVFNGLRWFVCAGCPWRMMPNDLPPWHVVFQQTQRWIKAQCFEAMAHDLRPVLRMALNRKEDPSAVILDSRTLQSTPESGAQPFWLLPPCFTEALGYSQESCRDK